MKSRAILFALIVVIFTGVNSACDARLLGLVFNLKSFDYGEVDRTQGQTHDFILKNVTGTVAHVTSLSLSGTNADEFKIESGDIAPFDMLPHQEKTFSVLFQPKTAGAKEAELFLMSTMVQSKVVRVKLEGFCHSADITPRVYDFGKIDLGQKDTHFFSVTNKTNRDINVTSIEVLENGNLTNHFRILNGSPGMLPPLTGSLDINVEFEPLSYGSREANLIIKTDDVTFSEITCRINGYGNFEIYEDFNTNTMCDTANTTAEWNTITSGKLVPTGLTNFGTGADGIYHPTTDSDLDADLGPFEFSEVYIPSGVTITVIGTQKLEIICQGKVVIDGEIILDGEDGQNAGVGGVGGPGGPGGYVGGDGGIVDAGDPGSGPGGGGAAVERSGGGGGHALTGQEGFSAGFNGAPGGTFYGNASLTTVEGGSGGGGGAVDRNIYYSNYTGGGPGGGGGGGGGAMLLTAGGIVEVNGLISANGGNGGGHAIPADSMSMCFGGGGGSGGAVKIISAIDINFDGGVISVRGGWGGDGMVYANDTRNRGGYGSAGRIRLEDSDGIIDGVGGSVFPAPSCEFYSVAFSGGTGADGAFNPVASTKLNTNNGPFNFTSVNIPSGVTVTAEGDQPLEIYCTGEVEIYGTIDVSGADALYHNPGVGQLGGYSGGAGGAGMTNGVNGLGAGGGRGGSGSIGWGGASGGGFGTMGQKGSRDLLNPGGAIYGSESLNPLMGGSGGGGGGGDYTDPAYAGGAGGAGGGAIRIQAAGNITIYPDGKILSNGGKGGNYGGMFALPGAGGSGGGILLQCNRLKIQGRISAQGGPAGDVAGVIGGSTVQGDEPPNFTGSWGGEGRIRLEAIDGSLGGMLISMIGKFSSPIPPGINPDLSGTSSVDLAPLQAGLIGQSLWFNSTIEDPAWKDAVLTGDYTELMQVFYEGAEDDGAGQPDPTTFTGWKDNPADIGRTKFMRFKVVFTIGANKPELDRIDLPFTD